MDCRGCRYYKNLADNHCIGCDGSRYTKPSNADKLRSMSDEELAEFFVWMCPPGKNEILSCEPQKELCHQCWLDWLRQEASDG